MDKRNNMIYYYNINASDRETFSIKGKGENNLLLLISEPESELFHTKLKEIIGAIKLDLENDAYYLYEAKKYQHIGQFVNSNDIENVIVFGLNPKEVNLNIECKLYNPGFLENIRIVFVDPISKILSDKSIKLKFWKLLQHLFLK